MIFAATDRPIYEPAGRVHAFCHAVPGPLAPDVGDAVGRRQPALVPRRARARRGRSATLVEEAATVAGRQRRARVPAVPDRRAQPAPGSAGPRRVRRADGRATTGAHLTRAVLEGVAFGLRDGLDLMVAAGHAAHPPRSARPAAGSPARSGARSSPTSSTRRSRRSSTTEGAAYGAALLAAVGAGWFETRRRRRRRRVTADAGRAHPGPTRARYRDVHARVSRALSGAGALVPRGPERLAAARGRHPRSRSRASSLLGRPRRASCPG